MRFLQNYPHFLEVTYDWTHRVIQLFRRWLQPNGGSLERAVTWGEEAGKRAIFDCRMCGQCILHSTGMTCPMTCPKNLRNGPCGGVRMNGHCEVKPEMPCVWVQAYERSRRMPEYGHEMLAVQPPVNKQLEGTSAWINMLHGIDEELPKGWIRVNDIDINFYENGAKEKNSWTKISNQAAV